MEAGTATSSSSSSDNVTLPPSLLQTFSGSRSGLKSILKEGFTPLGKEYVRDFLFKSMPERDLTILTSPLQLQHAACGKIFSMCTEEETGESVPIFLMNISADWVLIPAFNIEEYSASIFVENLKGSGPKDEHMRSSRNRYIHVVRNEQDSSMLGVSHDTKTGFSDMMFVSYITHRRRNRVYARFKGKELVRAVNDSSALNLDDILSSLMYVNVVDETRECAQCTLADCTDCLCHAHPIRPTHPLDFTNFARNLFITSGSFTGSCLHNLRIMPIPLISRPLIVRASFQGGGDPGVMPRMVSWAISSQLRQSNVLFNLIAPELLGKPLYDPFLVPDHDTELLPVEAPDSSINSDQKYSASNSQHNDLMSLLPSNTCAEQLSRCGAVVNPHIIRSLPGLNSSAPQLSGLQIPCQSDKANNLPSVPLDIGDDPLADLMGTDPMNDDTSAVPSMHLVLGDASPDTFCLTSMQSQVAPFTLKTVADVAEAEKKAKKMRRILRNRESAARSNLRKQIRGQELKSDIAVTKRKADSLRQRLTELKAENVRLKTQVAQMDENT